MPKKSGIEMIEDIKNLNPNQEIIVISAYSDSDKLIKLIELGINEFLLKPISLKKLVSKLSKTCTNIVNKKQKEEFLITQSKNAAMGEMIDMIAHQWINHLNIMQIKTEYTKLISSSSNIEAKQLQEYLNAQLTSLNHLNTTLREFRNFFQDSNNIESIYFNRLLESTLVLMKDTLVKNSIKITNECDDELSINVTKNEFKHVLINLIQNSIDAFNDNHIEKREIKFKCFHQNSKTVLEYIDNAGGIDEKIIESIFNARVTTKKYGSGMGMHLIKLIINKLNASIKVENFEEGAKFSLILD